MSALPPCPLCGSQSKPFGDGRSFQCSKSGCSMGYEETGFSEAEWLRLAAARPLPATVRAVMEAAELFVVGMKMTGGQWRLAGSVEAWIAAGRPGLEEK